MLGLHDQIICLLILPVVTGGLGGGLGVCGDGAQSSAPRWAGLRDLVMEPKEGGGGGGGGGVGVKLLSTNVS